MCEPQGQIITKEAIHAAIGTWVARAQRVIDDEWARSKNVGPTPVLSVDPKGRRYVRILRKDRPEHLFGSVFAFIDLTTGDVLKPDGWKRPSPIPRGNVLDEKGGMQCVGAYGIVGMR